MVLLCSALEASSQLGGEDLEPFYELLEGGRDGDLFLELEDYFYCALLRSQNVDTMETRETSTKISLSQVPFVMRALGYYPTEQEVDDMINEVKFSEYVETGKYVEDIELGELIKCKFYNECAEMSYFDFDLRLLHMMNVRFSLLNMAQRILGVTLPNF